MEVGIASVTYESKSSQDKLAWKADLVQYSKAAYECYGEDYGKVAGCVHEYLSKHYTENAWTVLAYPKEYSTTSYTFCSPYACQVECKNKVTARAHRVEAFSPWGTEMLQKSFKVNPEIAAVRTVSIIEKSAEIDEDIILGAIGPHILKGQEGNVFTWSEALSKFRPQSRYCLIKCRAGGFAGMYKPGNYYIFQYEDKVYGCFQQK